MSVINRIRNRLSDESIKDAVLEEMAEVATDRLCIRLGEETLPLRFESICADAVIKMYRRIYYEGISSENITSISTSFVDNVLAEYEREISDYKDQKANTRGSGRIVRFI